MIIDEHRRAGVRFVDASRTGRRYYTVTGSPLGELVLVGDGDALTRIELLGDLLHGPGVDAGWIADTVPSLADTAERLRAYFAGDLTTFDLPVAPEGTTFQHLVWRHLAEIPYGATTTYGTIAHVIGRPAAARAVGAANGRNPLPIILPCHRVIASTGSLVHYGLGGVACKRLLLDLEGRPRA